MKINIIGSGFTGLACAYFLAQENHQVTVFSSPQEKGASAIAAGLVHPFTGAHSKLNRRGFEGFAEAEQLFHIAQAATELPIVMHRGLLRLALDEQQASDFKANALLFPENEWRPSNQIPGLTQAPCLWIPKAYTINATNYIAGLTQACKQLGVEFLDHNVTTLESPVVIAAGRSIASFFPEVKASFIKGQLLRLKWPEDLSPLPFALNSKAYIVMDQDQKSCWVGATFEKGFVSDKPDVDFAIKDIMPKALEIIPALEASQILDCQAGIRVSTPNHLPLIKEIRPRQWVVTGMGSKGLLYHALIGKELANSVNNS